MRIAALILGLAIAVAADAQEAKKKKPAAKKPAAHSKATPEQIRKFKQLEEKRKK